MICYHGSDTIVDAPKILEATRPLDFGRGFYVTTSKQQARSWAIKDAYRNNVITDVSINMSLDIERAKAELTLISFEKADEKWLDFICNNRNGKPTGEYDIVTGPVADDRVYRVVVEYENGDIDRENAL